jgi:hypothetical protein
MTFNLKKVVAMVERWRKLFKKVISRVHNHWAEIKSCLYRERIRPNNMVMKSGKDETENYAKAFMSGLCELPPK